MHGKVMDFQDGDPEPGSKVIMSQLEEGRDSQMWFEDRHNLIRSKLNEYLLDHSGTMSYIS